MAKRKHTNIRDQLVNFEQHVNRKTNPRRDEVTFTPQAVIYCRVSDMQQVTHGNGLNSQEDKCSEWCSKQSPKIEVAQVFQEPGVSGATLDRPALNESIMYIKEQNRKQKTISHFVITEASRLSRPEDIAEAFQLEDSISSLGVKIVKVDSPGIDESTDEGTFLKTIMYATAGYERKKISQRSMNGKISKLKKGYRPFPSPPAGYVRERKGTKEYEDIIEPTTGSIIKEGLELFAGNIIETQADLWRFWLKKGLSANNKKGHGILQRTFIEKVFYLHRLFYYAGYIYYPKRGVTKPFKGKHLGLIELNTAHAIINKLKDVHVKQSIKKKSFEKMTDKFPLRGAFICAECGRKYTSRTTTKHRTKNGKKIIKRYPYYGCGNPDCKDRANIPKSDLEKQFEDYLTNYGIGEIASKLIETIFNKEATDMYINFFKNASLKKIEKIVEKQHKIEEMMLRIQNDKLQNKFEKDWSELEKEKDTISASIENSEYSFNKTQNLLNQIVEMYQNPVLLWRKSDSETRKLLFRVRCGDYLLHSKKSGVKTAETAGGNSGLLYFFTSISVCRDTWATYKTEPMQLVEEIYKFLKPMEEEIEYLSQLQIEYKGRERGMEN